MRHMKWNRMVWGFLVLGLLLPRVGIAQEVWTVQSKEGGWIGITVDFTSGLIGEEEVTVVVITDVVKGGPAEEAGIRVGDTITHMDGRPVSQKMFLSLPETLEPGDLVRMVVKRDDGPREILLEARERPRSQVFFTRPDAEGLVIQLQALSGNISRELDSLRLSIEGLHLDSTSGNLSVQVLRTPRLSDEVGEIGFSFHIAEPFLDTLSFEPDVFYLAPELAMPFQAMIVQSQATTELQQEMLRLRKELTSVRRKELSRTRELRASIQGPIEEILKEDERIQDLREEEAELVAQQEELVARLRQVSEMEMQRQWMEFDQQREGALARAYQAQNEAIEAQQAESRARALENYEMVLRESRSPVLLGQNFMLGAKLERLNPEIAEYFSVDEGVFVVEVVEGTPASEAGLRGGDVIVRVGGEEVTTLSDLRFGLNAFEGPLRIRVVRKGEPVEITIRR